MCIYIYINLINHSELEVIFTNLAFTANYRAPPCIIYPGHEAGSAGMLSFAPPLDPSDPSDLDLAVPAALVAAGATA